MIIFATSVIFVLAFNILQKYKCDTLILKSINWFIVSVITSSLIVYAFPVVLISIAFIFPLLHNSVSLFGWNRQKGQSHYNKEWVVSILFFVTWLALGVSILLGTVIFTNQSIHVKVATIKQMVTTIITDYYCVGSNCWVYFCCLLLPNILTII